LYLLEFLLFFSDCNTLDMDGLPGWGAIDVEWKP
jgi:hypothetical protein